MTGFGSSCGACKFLRRKCTTQCVFAPYFCYDEAANHFAAVHKVFGASNVSKLLLHLPIHYRSEAATTISYEALARMTDPIYGCVAHIFALQQQVAYLQEEIEILGNQMANFTPFNGVTDSCGSSAANHNDNPIYAGSHLLHHDYAINTQYHQNQQALVHSHAENNEVANYDHQALDHAQMDIQVPLCGLMEEQDMLCGGHSGTPDNLEKLFELETEPGNLGNYPWSLDDNTSLL
ncbi:LOB domain-containing protein 29 [Ziziphus jujuba]|uniref:LOB domain-containing protein 29 n=2 Tax=Ziziphus jujuba TaxID=326968 RepID=A0A6P6G011_ZIZJJ|nr:LOB domain-containing protein 29 [Ziziphus jujuba]KAH7537157.1 hypothetical protein FEM48_Zijuj03G0062200 [Ziziphus jujuba var. spinosa]